MALAVLILAAMFLLPAMAWLGFDQPRAFEGKGGEEQGWGIYFLF